MTTHDNTLHTILKKREASHAIDIRQSSSNLMDNDKSGPIDKKKELDDAETDVRVKLSEASHAIHMRQLQLFDLVDEDNSGQIDKKEFGQLYDVVLDETEKDLRAKLAAETSAARNNRKIKLFACLVIAMAFFLGLSVTANFLVTFALLEATKETEAKGGVLMVKGTNDTVKVASSEMIVDEDAMLVSPNGRNVQVDTAQHWESDLTSDDVVDRLLNSETRRQKLKAMSFSFGDDSKITFEVKAYDTSTMYFFLNGTAVAASALPNRGHVGVIGLFHTSHPYFPAFVAVRVASETSTRSDAFLVNASLVNDYRCITLLAAECRAVDWAARLPSPESRRKMFLPSFAGFAMSFAMSFVSGLFSVSGVTFSNFNFGSLPTTTPALWRSFSEGWVYPQSRRLEGRSLTSSVMRDAVLAWSSRPDVTEAWCQCWVTSWNDAYATSGEWSEAQSPRGSFGTVAYGDGMQQFLDWIGGQAGRRLLAVGKEFEQKYGRRLSDALADDPDDPALVG